MQETTIAPQFLRLRVWALTVAFAASAFVVGLLSLPVHLLKMHRRGPGELPGGPGAWPGGRVQPWPTPSGAPQPYGGAMGPHAWGAHPMMMAHHGVALALLLIVIFAIVAGIAGAIIAAVYNALLPKA